MKGGALRGGEVVAVGRVGREPCYTLSGPQNHTNRAGITPGRFFPLRRSLSRWLFAGMVGVQMVPERAELQETTGFSMPRCQARRVTIPVRS